MSKELLKKLTSKKNVYFLEGATEAFEYLMKHLEPKTISLQQEGGWYKYPKVAKKLGIQINYLKTQKGKINPKEIQEIACINLMPGYAYHEDVDSIEKHAKQNNATLISDVTASIGTLKVKGDYIIGSFGPNKPLTIKGGGGFIATNQKLQIREENLDPKLIETAINNLTKKLAHWQKIKTEIEKQIPTLNKGEGINVFIEKETYIKQLKENFDIVKGPVYNRSLKPIISIEIKRK